METKTEKFGIFPTCLNCYNNGYLVGYWYKFDHKENIQDLEKAMSIPVIHAKANAKGFVGCDEVFITDYEYLKVDEYEQPAEIIEKLEVFNDLEYDLALHYLENKNDYTLEALKNAYSVEYSEYEDYIYQWFIDCFDTQDNLLEDIWWALNMKSIKHYFEDIFEVIEIDLKYYIVDRY
jgi:hypothetical protein